MEIEILGGVDVYVDGVGMQLARRQHRLILGILALSAGHRVSTDRLIELLWDQPPATARAAVHSRVSELRTGLARAAPQQPLHTSGDGYLLELAPDQVDAHRFQRLVGRAHSGVPAEQARVLLQDALALWRGPMLGGWLPEEAHARLCQGLEAARVTAWEDFYEIELDLGRHRSVADDLLASAADHPGRERLAAQAMVALSRTGRTAEAVQVYDRCRRWLDAELGLDPGTKLQKLNLKLLGGGAEPAAVPARTGGAAEATREPERAAADPEAGVVLQLPAGVVNFVGRARHIELLADLLSAGPAREAPPLVTLSGPPGAGKTALAVHLGHQLRPVFPDGQLFVNLRGYAPEPPLAADDVLHRFLRALGVRPDRIPGGQDEKGAMYRSAIAGQRMLLILDNAFSPDQVRPLLPGSRDCAVVVTSRDRLLGLTALDGAQQVLVGTLPDDEADLLLRRVLGEARVDGEPAATAELARLCGHLPLALRVAAANLAARPDRTIESYVAQVRSGSRLGELAIPGDDQAAVQPAIDLSYRLLNPTAAAVFRRLGLVPGPDFDPHAAAAVAGVPVSEARRSLDGLVTANLVEAYGGSRYQLHDLIQEYARKEVLAHDGPEACRASMTRLFTHYLSAVAAATGVLYPDAPRPPAPALPPTVPIPDRSTGTALGWLEREVPNVVAAIFDPFASETGQPVWLLADALYGYFLRQRRYALWRQTFTAALAAASAAGQPAARAAMHVGLANCDFQTARPKDANWHFDEAIWLFRQCGDLSGEARGYNGFGMLAATLGDYERATECFGRALALFRKAGEERLGASVECNLGNMLANAGELAEGLSTLRRAEATARRLGLRHVLARVKTGAAFIQSLSGDLGPTVDELSEALAIWSDPPNQAGQAEVSRFLAAVHLERGELAEAHALAEVAIRLADEIGDVWLTLGGRLVVGEVLLAEGRADDAAGHFEHVRSGEPEGWRHYRMWATVGLAACRRVSGDLVVAEELAIEAATDRRPYIRALAALELSQVALAHGAAVAAVDRATEASELARKYSFRLVSARALWLLSEAQHLRGDVAAARDIGEAALTALDALGVADRVTVRQRLRSRSPFAGPVHTPDRRTARGVP